VNNARPFRYQIEQHGALALVHGGSLQALGLDGLAILPRSEHKIGYAVVENRLFPLGLVEGVQQSESFVVLLAERPHGLAVQRVESGLSGGQARRENTPLAGDRDVERQMMAAKLQDPGVLFGGCSEDGNVEEVLAEHRVVPSAGFENLVAFHDLLNFLESPRAEGG